MQHQGMPQAAPSLGPSLAEARPMYAGLAVDMVARQPQEFSGEELGVSIEHDDERHARVSARLVRVRSRARARARARARGQG